MMRHWILAWIATVVASQSAIAGSGDTTSVDTLQATLDRAQRQGDWLQTRLPDGRQLIFQVAGVRHDSVVVRERMGPLYRHLAIYPLEAFAAWKPVNGLQAPRSAEARSLAAALSLEAVLPGAGFYYTGDYRTATLLVGVAALAGGTALATGEEGAAGWVPAMVWLKIASLVHLRDQVRAMNGRDARGTRRGTGGPAVSPGHFLHQGAPAQAASEHGHWIPGFALSVRF